MGQGIYKIAIANAIFKVAKIFSLYYVKDKTRCPSLLLFNFILAVLANAVRQEKEIKGIRIGKEETKLSLFSGDMIACVAYLKDSIGNF